jgi:hypothetical protein
VALDQMGVPAQQGAGRHDPVEAAGEEPAQPAEDGSVGPGERRWWVLAAKDGEFVAQGEDLDVLGGVGSGQEREPAEHTEQHQVDQRERHDGRSAHAAGPSTGEQARLPNA